MKSHHERRLFCPKWTWPGFIAFACQLLTAGVLCGQAAKPEGDKAAWQKHLDEMAKRTEQNQKGFPAGPSAAPQRPTSTGNPAPAPAPASPSALPIPASARQGTLELFEDDFDRTGPISFVQHRVVLLVFAPQIETDAWRTSTDLLPWAHRAVICPVHEGSLGDRAQRLAKAFGIDPVKGGILTALVRAPDGVQQVAGDQLLYQVLGRYPPPQDDLDVIKVLQEAVAAYDAKKTQYAWNATLTGSYIPAASPPAAATSPPTSPPTAAPATPSPVTAAPSPAMPAEPAPLVKIKPPKPVEPQRSAFETAVTRAWQTHRPIMLIFPGHEPFDKAKCAEAWRSIPGALAPELLVLTPGSADGSVGGKPMDWEAFFDVGGQYPHALMIMPESEGDAASPGAADMTYRVIARRQGALNADMASSLALLWMSEDFDAVVMRAWVLRRPMLIVFPHAERQRDLLESPVLAKLEERAAVFVNTKDGVSGIRSKTAAEVEKEFATEAVERSEVVLVKLETKNKDASSVRLDQIQLTPVNRAFAKKSADKIFEWANSRVPAKPSRGGAKP